MASCLGVARAVDLDCQRFAFKVGLQVGLGLEDLPGQRSGFVAMMHVKLLPDDLCDRRFGPVGDDFDRVDEVFAAVG